MSQDQEPLTPEELKEQQELEQQISQVRSRLEKFSTIQDKIGNMPDPNNMFEQSLPQLNIEELPAIDRRGNIVYSNKVIREKYFNAPPILRYLQLPYCYQSITKKVKFWGIMSLAMAYTYQAKKSIESGQGLKGIRFKPLLKSYLFIAALGISFSLIESIFFEDYCDVNSYHYIDNLDRKNVIENIKRKFKSK